MNDTISRHGTSAWLENMGHPNLAKMIMDEKRFPSVQPEPKRGKWIFIHPIQNNDCGGYMCSCCKSGDFGITTEYAFCPYCGADMRTAAQIVHDAIDNTPMAEDAFPGIKERLHKAVDEIGG